MEQRVDAHRINDEGVLAVGIESTALATEKTIGAWFGLWRDVRSELTQRATSAIDWVDGVQQGTTRLARAVVQRTDEVAGAWLDANERLTMGLVRAMRSTGHGVSRFASRTASSLTSTRPEVIAQA